MPSGLRPGLSFADLGSRLVFLDVVADRYFCLPDPIERDFRALLSAGAPATPATSVARLLDVTQSPSAAPGRLHPCPRPPILQTSLIEPNRDRTSLLRAGRAAVAVTASLARLRWRSLAYNLRSIPSANDYIRTASSSDLAGIAAAFARASGWISAQDRCLAQSLAVARAARRAGIAVDVVFGVALGPFRAHCWVQHGSTVVNDRVETVTRYTPILVT